MDSWREGQRTCLKWVAVEPAAGERGKELGLQTGDKGLQTGADASHYGKRHPHLHLRCCGQCETGGCETGWCRYCPVPTQTAQPGGRWAHFQTHLRLAMGSTRPQVARSASVMAKRLSPQKKRIWAGLVSDMGRVEHGLGFRNNLGWVQRELGPGKKLSPQVRRPTLQGIFLTRVQQAPHPFCAAAPGPCWS